MSIARNRREITPTRKPVNGSLKNHNIATIKKRPAMDEILSNTDKVLAVTSGTSWISSLPSKVMLPSSTSHDASPIVTSEVTDLPHPDSPTTPRLVPRSRLKLILSNIFIEPDWCSVLTVKFFTVNKLRKFEFKVFKSKKY